jgi:hypothetical protein
MVVFASEAIRCCYLKQQLPPRGVRPFQQHSEKEQCARVGAAARAVGSVEVVEILVLRHLRRQTAAPERERLS